MGRSRAASAVAEDELNQRSKRRRFTLGTESLETPSAGASEAKRAAYHCNYCNKDVSGTIRIKCAKCADFDLCIECFSVGVEVTTHKSNHPYRVIDNLSFPLIHPDWNADEEILLLEGIEMYGLGNWTEVSEHVGTKNKTQCYDHYMMEFMKSTCSPLPDMSNVVGKTKAELLAIGKAYSEGKKNLLPYGDGSAARVVKQEPTISPSRIKVEDLKTEYSEGRSPTRLSAGLKAGLKNEEADNQLSDSLPSNPLSAGKKAAGSQVKEAPDSGSVPNPGTEDAGQSTRSLGNKKPKPILDETKPSPTNTELTGYNAKRQEFDPEYDNEAELPIADMDFKDNDTDADRELKLQMLHIYLARLDERKRRKDFILERGLLNVKRQQADKKKSKEERELIQRSRVFLRYHSTEEHDALIAGLTAEIKIRQRIEELQEYRSAGCHTLAEGELYMMEKKKRGAEASLLKGREQLLNTKITNRSSRGMIRDGGEPSTSANSRDLQRVRGGAALPKLTSVGMKTTTKKSSFAPLDLAGFPGTDLLSSMEQELCSQLRLLPAHYLKMKEILMLENADKGCLRREDACLMFKIDPSKTERVFDFLSKMGWIESSSNNNMLLTL